MDTPAILEVSLTIICPLCEHEFDLFQLDDSQDYMYPIFNNRWDDLIGESIDCPMCTKQLTIEVIEW